jgi:hypothetical protein
VASLASLPITSSLNAIAKSVSKKALYRQILLYVRARDAGCSPERIRNNTCDLILLDDVGWIHSAVIKGDKIEACRGAICSPPSPLTPAEVFDYADFLYGIETTASDLKKDLSTIKKIMEENIAFCAIS